MRRVVTAIACYRPFLLSVLSPYYPGRALVHDLHSTAPGFATFVILLLVLNCIMMLLLGIIGEYLAQIVLEVNDRPTSMVERLVEFEDCPACNRES